MIIELEFYCHLSGECLKFLLRVNEIIDNQKNHET